jgi:hypothetical protein
VIEAAVDQLPGAVVEERIAPHHAGLPAQGRSQPQLGQHGLRPPADGEACPDLAQCVGLFVHRDLETGIHQRQRSYQAADPGADHRNSCAAHGAVPPNI